MPMGECTHRRTHRLNYASSKMCEMLGSGRIGLVGTMMGMSGDVGANTLGSGTTASVHYAGATSSVSAILSCVGLTSVIFSDSSSTSIILFGSGFSSSRLT